MTLVIDASVALKWVLPEEGSDRARALVGAEPLVAPDFLWLECANVLTMRSRRGLFDTATALAAQAVIEAAPVRRVPLTPHLSAAQRIAAEIERSVYDSLYLAIALAERAVLITADAKFANAALGRDDYAKAIRLL